MPISHFADPRLAAIVDSSDDAIITHGLDGTIETWNPTAARLFGYRPDEIVGRSVLLLLPPEARNRDADVIQRLKQNQVVEHRETHGLTRDGAIVAISMSIVPVITPHNDVVGFVRLMRDLSAPRSAHDTLQLAAIVDSSEDAIISKDLNGSVQTWNKAAERMFGYTAGEMIGQSITRIIPEERLSEEETVLSRVRAGLRVEPFETVRQRKDGSRVEVSLAVSPIRAPSGTVVGASKIARDITVTRLLTREAEEANRVKDEFLATLSHELRTPLNAVLGYTRMLRSGNLSADRQERAVDVIERNAALLHQLVSDVLDVSGIVTGKMRVSPVTCDLSTIVQAACDSVQPTSEAKGVPIAVHTPAQPVLVRCDTDRMQQVFWNLIANAVKFTPRGGQVSVTIDAIDETGRVTISDSGIGITRDALPHVFQRFWQGESVNSRQTGGLGLGLALARHFVELHAGTITAESRGSGSGATFIVRLPLKP